MQLEKFRGAKYGIDVLNRLMRDSRKAYDGDGDGDRDGDGDGDGDGEYSSRTGSNAFHSNGRRQFLARR